MAIQDMLLQQADEIADAGLKGWGNTMRDAAAEIARLTAELAAEREVHANAARRSEYHHQEHLAANREIERLRAFVAAFDAWKEYQDVGLEGAEQRCTMLAAREAVGPCS